MKRNNMITALTIAMAIMGSQHAPADDTVVAKIGTREVKAAEIKPYLDDLTAEERGALSRDKAALERFVRGILVRDAVLGDAAAAGWDKKPEVTRGIERVRDQYLVESYLLEVSKVPADYPSEKELKDTYLAERSNLNLPKRLELSQIFISSVEGKDAAKKKADNLAASLKETPADFGRLARENSDEAESAPRDGKIGWLAEQSIAPDIRKTASSLSKGEISAVVEGREGYHILRLDDVREAGPASFEEAEPELRQALRNRRALLNREAHLSALLEKQPVSVNELALETLSKNANE